jgi:hypothetical protein
MKLLRVLDQPERPWTQLAFHRQGFQGFFASENNEDDEFAFFWKQRTQRFSTLSISHCPAVLRPIENLLGNESIGFFNELFQDDPSFSDVFADECMDLAFGGLMGFVSHSLMLAGHAGVPRFS